MEQIDQVHSFESNNKQANHNHAPSSIEEFSAQIKLLALQSQANPKEILHILRVLEQLHSEICAEIFQPALPNSRHALFDFLKDIEAKGGWPHIYRRTLSQLLGSDFFEEQLAEQDDSSVPDSDNLDSDL